MLGLKLVHVTGKAQSVESKNQITDSICSSGEHGDGNILISIKYSPPAAPEVINMTTSSVASDANFVKMTLHGDVTIWFQAIY